MDFNHRKADLLCRRYLDATASEAETDSLRRMLCDAPHDVLTPQMRLCATMLRGFEALRTERIPERPRRRTLRLRLAAAIGIAAACAAGILLIGRPTVYGYIDGRPITDPAEAMAATVYFEPLEELAESLELAGRILTPETH